MSDINRPGDGTDDGAGSPESSLSRAGRHEVSPAASNSQVYDQEAYDRDLATAVSVKDGDVIGEGGLPARFENPGLPPHQPRMSDLSEAGAQRAARQVSTLFAISIIATIGFVVAYFVVPVQHMMFFPGLGRISTSNFFLGLTMGLSLLGIGAGAVHWAKTLMNDEEVVEMRHPMRSADEDRAAVGATLAEGDQVSGLSRRPMIKYTLGAALGIFALPVILPVIGGLGPLDRPYRRFEHSFWDGHETDAEGNHIFERPRLVRDPQNTPIRPEEVTIGSAYHVQPDGLFELSAHHQLEEKAKSSVLLMRLDPASFKDTEAGQKAREWGYEGIVAYSKICTHVGCPVGLYEQHTHHLLCPCHQSTFDVTDDCKVIFGPAKRPLPQLKITVDDEGYLVADQPFAEPVGPSYWERERRA
ncbi:MAG: Rieske 2Fe-2S domain-containing protein [Actinomycetia bacterium]|nr:Rieske 2Fe-2S domain-containing protein [Actinomycetes bacterium]